MIRFRRRTRRTSTPTQVVEHQLLILGDVKESQVIRAHSYVRQGSNQPCRLVEGRIRTSLLEVLHTRYADSVSKREPLNVTVVINNMLGLTVIGPYWLVMNREAISIALQDTPSDEGDLSLLELLRNLVSPYKTSCRGIIIVNDDGLRFVSNFESDLDVMQAAMG